LRIIEKGVNPTAASFRASVCSVINIDIGFLLLVSYIRVHHGENYHFSFRILCYTVPHVLCEFRGDRNTPLGEGHIEMDTWVRDLDLRYPCTTAESRAQETGSIRRDVTKLTCLLTHHNRHYECKEPPRWVHAVVMVSVNNSLKTIKVFDSIMGLGNNLLHDAKDEKVQQPKIKHTLQVQRNEHDSLPSKNTGGYIISSYFVLTCSSHSGSCSAYEAR